MYADSISEQMQLAIDETNRRRQIQKQYNTKYNVQPYTVVKDIRDNIALNDFLDEDIKENQKVDIKKLNYRIKDLEKEMLQAAKNLDFEKAAELRDIIFELKVIKAEN